MVDFGKDFNDYVKNLKETKFPPILRKEIDTKTVQLKLCFEGVKMDKEKIVYGGEHHLGELLEDKFRQLDWDWTEFAKWMMNSSFEKRRE